MAWRDKIKSRVQLAYEALGNMPIAKAIGGAITNPTPQGVGESIYNLGRDVSSNLESSFGSGSTPEEMAINFSPVGAMTAYHGTPHKIVGGFDKAKIGTGEGAQAFGHGFYATESKGIAKGYAKDLSKYIYEISGQRFEANPLSNNLEIFQTWDKYGKDYAIKFAENEKRGLLGSGPFTIKEAQEKGADSLVRIRQKRVEELDKLIPLIKEGELKKIPTGRIYTLDIPEPDVMLDWDKKLSEHGELSNRIKNIILEALDTEKAKTTTWPPAIKSIDHLKATIGKGPEWYKEAGITQFDDLNGMQIYNELSNVLGSESAASSFLESRGIKGINYPAGTISGAKTDARNFVVFEPQDIKITAEEFLDQ